MEAVVLCGIQGSGKSHFAKRLGATHAHVCADQLGGRDRDVAAECLAAGRPFVIDDLNATAAERSHWIAAARAAGYRVIGYLFDVRPSVAIRRNGRRAPAAQVPWGGIVGTARRLEPPTLAEGFDAIWRVGEDGRATPVAARPARARAA